MQNKGCLLFLLIVAGFFALAALGFVGLFTARKVSYVESTPSNVHVTVERSNGSFPIQHGSDFSNTTFVAAPPYHVKSYAHLSVLAFFAIGILAGILFVLVLLRGRRNARSSCAPPEPDATDELQQLYGNIKRMEQRLQTLETILTDKCSSKE